jgi:putative pyruvate formate lyase activating enzyme
VILRTLQIKAIMSDPTSTLFDYSLYKSCELCPRECGVNRLQGERGICDETAELRIAAIEAHFGEEPPISGTNGSGTVFFAGCTLRCAFCQNFQISCFHLGEIQSAKQVAERLARLVDQRAIHNVNFVTPDHFLPHTIEIVNELRRRNIDLPILYNTSGYCKVSSLRLLEGIADMYLPDFKYADAELAAELSHARDYPDIALAAIAEMVRQTGFLDSFMRNRALASRGVLVRHLVLPGRVQNSIQALTMLLLEFGRDLPISLMSQYWPARSLDLPEMNRRLRAQEFMQVSEHADSLGFNHLFVQPMEGTTDTESDFLPDFERARPFKGNIREI